MAYFLKKSKLKKGLYLQIYESFYNPQKGQTAHRSYKAIGYENELKEKGIEDPIAYYQQEVDRLNTERKSRRTQEKQKQIGEETPEKYLGYFPLKSINEPLGVKKYMDLMQTATDFKFNVYEMMSALIYARVLQPCSKRKTYSEILPKLFEKCNFSLNQLYDGLEYIGQEYEKIIEIYNAQINRRYPFDIGHTYFDCTNFYFEIDKEDDFRRKGPSKENRRDPIVGLGLLLDAHQIPIGMKLFPGNQSEKPVIRSIIDNLKQRNQITGRTIQIADKGLNCADNIYHAIRAGDGYIFSKSVKQLSDVEKTWIQLPQDYHSVTDSDGTVLYSYKECTADFKYRITDENGNRREITLTEKRVATYNPKLADKQRREINKEVEKARLLTLSKAKRAEFGDAGKYIRFEAADKKGEDSDGRVSVSVNEDAVREDLMLAGYNLLVTSEIHMSAQELYSAYHNLWRIEESFRVMKSQLDARPVYLQKEDTITGHFLICYLSVLLTRLLQFKVLDNAYSSECIFDFLRDFRVVQASDTLFINLSRTSVFLQNFSSLTGLPLASYYLNNTQIHSILSHRF